MRVWGSIGLAVMLCGLGATAARGGVAIPGVPYYEWYYGCGPTAGGMIIGYWDGQPGLGDLVPGSNDWGTNAAGIKDMIASPGHIADYVGWGAGIDGPLPYHADDSVADFMACSRGALADYLSTFSMQDNGLVGYAVYRGHASAVALNTTYDNTGLWDSGAYWNTFVAEIDAGRPVEFYVDNNADGTPEHFVVGFGYDAATKQYACLDPSAAGLHWYDFARPAAGQAFGVRGATFFDPAPEPATMGLLAAGFGVVAVGRRLRHRTSPQA